MQNIFTERKEAFCMQLLPGLRNFTSTGICSKRRDLYLSDIWREFVGMEVKQAESSMFIPFTPEIKGFLNPAYSDLNWQDMTSQFDVNIWNCIYFCVCLRNAH
jgi:hypothetical protein